MTVVPARHRQLARSVIVGLATVVILVFALRSVWLVFRATGPGAEPISGYAHRKEIYDCVMSEIRDRVPAGTSVHVRADQPVDPDLWHQRLVEMSYPFAVVVDDPDQAAYELGVVAVAADTGCRGVEVTVVPRR